MATLTVTEQIPGSGSTDFIDVIVPEHTTVRQLICDYVEQQFNRRTNEPAKPNSFLLAKEERMTNPVPKTRFTIEQLKERALSAFTDNQIILLLNDRQAEKLDEIIEITNKSNVTFLRLTPLIGG